MARAQRCGGRLPLATVAVVVGRIAVDEAVGHEEVDDRVVGEGAGRVAGVDIDPLAVEAARANAERNGVTALFADSAQPVAGEYDVVVANILSNPLRVLAPAICAHVRSGGRLALSGILREQADEIIGIYAQWLPLEIADVREDWVCLAGRKP